MKFTSEQKKEIYNNSDTHSAFYIGFFNDEKDGFFNAKIGETAKLNARMTVLEQEEKFVKIHHIDLPNDKISRLFVEGFVRLFTSKMRGTTQFWNDRFHVDSKMFTPLAWCGEVVKIANIATKMLKAINNNPKKVLEKLEQIADEYEN